MFPKGRVLGSIMYLIFRFFILRKGQSLCTAAQGMPEVPQCVQAAGTLRCALAELWKHDKMVPPPFPNTSSPPKTTMWPNRPLRAERAPRRTGLPSVRARLRTPATGGAEPGMMLPAYSPAAVTLGWSPNPPSPPFSFSASPASKHYMHFPGPFL